MNEFGPAASLVVWTLSVTAVFFGLDLWRRIAETAPAFSARAGVVLAAWLGVALLATFLPELGGRIVSVPGLPQALFVALVVALTWLGFRPAFRRAFDAIGLESLVGFFYWRAIFGALLLAAYAAGRLPAGFGIPAGLGDMAVTLLAVVLLAVKTPSGDLPRGPLALWNALGLLDLLGVLVLGATVLRPWAAQRGLVGGNFSLQLFVVPIFVALHLCIFDRLRRLK